jgi:GAF domain
MSGGRVADILASLAVGGPATGWPAQLVEACSVSTNMTGVGLALMGPTGVSGVLAATDGDAQRMEDLQFVLGEGPCVDANRSGRPVLIPDLGRTAADRWPAFAPSATDLGVVAAFTFPLRAGAISFGVLDLYRRTRGPLTDHELVEALAFADAGAAVLLHLRYGTDEGPGVVPGEGPGLAFDSVDGDLDVTDVLDRRAAVHQAAGMISVQLMVGLATALLRLRLHAYTAERPILDVAEDVVARRMRFDHSDVGIVVTPPAPPPGTTSADEESP